MATKPVSAPSSDATPPPDNLALLFQEMFIVIARLRAQRQRLTDVEVFRMQIRNTLNGIEQQGLAGGYRMEDLRIAAFAVVAFLDESILDSGNPFFADWPCQPLQLELFGVRAAGEIFYRNLERVLARPESAGVADLLEVHQICLLLGFRGRYGLCRAQVEINAIVERLETRIHRLRGVASLAVWRPALPPAPAAGSRLPRYLRSVAFSLLHRRESPGNSAAITEMDLHFAAAAAWSHGPKALAALPAVLLLGDTASAKTTLIAQAGIQAELLAGHGALVPTQSVNLWHGWNTLFIDPAGALLADPAARSRLFRKLSSHAPRSVLLAVNCEIFFPPDDAGNFASQAAHSQLLLAELTREIGAGFPLHIVFTKADQIPYFQDFMLNLNPGEAAEPFGVTLSGRQSVSEAFEHLYRFLIAQRKILLAREQQPARLPDIYEFPREFVKLRPLLVEFLTHLGPLAGFYFTGLRPAADSASFDARQWLFVKRLFSEIILAQHPPSPLTTPRAMSAAAG